MPRFLFLYLLVLCGCESAREPSGKESTIPDTPQAMKDTGMGQVPKDQGGFIYESEVVRIIGDTTMDRSNIFYPEIKFEPYITFDDFKTTSVYKGAKAPIDFNSNKTAKEYRTILTKWYSDAEVTFAGHYTLIHWGCGTPCQAGAIVDMQNGKVYDIPFASLYYDFHPNSNLLIVNPPDESGFYVDCAYCHPEIWVWNDDTKQFRQIRASEDYNTP